MGIVGRNLIGERFGRLVVVSTSTRRSYFNCRCDCGKQTTVYRQNLQRGHTKSCGCLSIVDITGRRFGRLLIVKLVGTGTHGAIWHCLCDCGNWFNSRGDVIKSGSTLSCGCYNLDRISSHKLSKTPEYKTWISVRRRCNLPHDQNYHNYGARGIKVCRRWDKFENFYADMGERPTPKHSIDRKDNNKGYSPSNCRWATSVEQQNNTRRTTFLTFNGKTLSLNEWSRLLGFGRNLLWYRVVLAHWSVERALTTLPNKIGGVPSYS